MYFETHAHYDFAQYDNDRDELLNKILPEAGVSYVINIGIDMPSSISNIALAQKYDYFYAAIGFHPIDAHLMADGDIEKLEELSKKPKVIAIGEIGLDYFHDTSPKSVQMKCFIDQLELAKKVNLPVIIHSRDASEDVYETLKNSGICDGVLHCFSGDMKLADKYLEMGYHIGIGGIITYKNAQILQETVKYLPLDRILIETDCPFLSPDPYRGQRNDSGNLKYVVEKIAQLKGLPHREVARVTEENAIKLFKINTSQRHREHREKILK